MAIKRQTNRNKGRTAKKSKTTKIRKTTKRRVKRSGGGDNKTGRVWDNVFDFRFISDQDSKRRGVPSEEEQLRSQRAYDEKFKGDYSSSRLWDESISYADLEKISKTKCYGNYKYRCPRCGVTALCIIKPVPTKYLGKEEEFWPGFFCIACNLTIAQDQYKMHYNYPSGDTFPVGESRPPPPYPTLWEN